eukprot:250353_1
MGQLLQPVEDAITHITTQHLKKPTNSINQPEWECSKCRHMQSSANKECELCGDAKRAHTGCTEICSCDHLKRLQYSLSEYVAMVNEINDATPSINTTNEVDIVSLLDDFVHLINNHCKSDESFEYIFNTFGVCDITKCKLFQRNNRERHKCRNTTFRNELYSSYKNISNVDIARHQIIDKIHCYFSHCFDIGHRLSLKEKLFVHNANKDEKVEENALANCIEQHGLKLFSAYYEGFQCDQCQKLCKIKEPLYGCTSCDYELCQDCFMARHKIPIQKSASNCNGNHGLREYVFDEIKSLPCCICNEPMKKGTYYCCFECHSSYIVCSDCFVKEEETYDEEYLLMNHNLMRMKQILVQKTSNRNLIPFNRINSKYNSLDQYENDQKMYDFGVLFLYGFDGETDHKPNGSITQKHINKKFDSLKQEMIENDTTIMTIEQFQSEFKKASYHYHCAFRKKRYPDMMIQCLLSLMIYANYDAVQYTFSKTYRENIDSHANFYHLGMFLKISMHKFGGPFDDHTSILNIDDMYTNTMPFYHGISEKLNFPQILGDDVNAGKGVQILSPLSTTSSYEVAINFASQNQGGIVVEFGHGLTSSTQYFNMDWISDYGNEKEILFVQNVLDLRIYNIIDTKTYTAFELLIKALKIIDDQTCMRNGFDTNISWTMRNLIIKVIHHRLSYKHKGYKPFKSLDNYANKFIDIYFDKRDYVKLDYQLTKENEMIARIFGYMVGMVDFELISIVWPNATSVSIWWARCCCKTFDNLLHYLINNKSKIAYIEMKNIKTNTVGNSVIDSNWIIMKYGKRFANIGYTMNSKKSEIEIVKSATPSVLTQETKQEQQQEEKQEEKQEAQQEQQQEQIQVFVWAGDQEKALNRSFNLDNTLNDVIIAYRDEYSPEIKPNEWMLEYRLRDKPDSTVTLKSLGCGNKISFGLRYRALSFGFKLNALQIK